VKAEQKLFHCWRPLSNGTFLYFSIGEHHMSHDDTAVTKYFSTENRGHANPPAENSMLETLRSLFKSGEKPSDFRSGEYWDRRYKVGGTSGAGSYGRLARFKAEVINGFCAARGVQSVIEWGCGDGNQLHLYDFPRYLGVDVSPTSVEMCKSQFNDPTKRFLLTSEVTPELGMYDLALSIEVIFHLVEDDVFDAYMRNLFDYAAKYVCIYSSNTDRRTLHRHVRHRRFTDWIERHRPEWKRQSFVRNRYRVPIGFENKYFTFSDFYFFERR
jgi:SAM-dependent methyltransferase